MQYNNSQVNDASINMTDTPKVMHTLETHTAVYDKTDRFPRKPFRTQEHNVIKYVESAAYCY